MITIWINKSLSQKLLNICNRSFKTIQENIQVERNGHKKWEEKTNIKKIFNMEDH